MTIKLAYKAQEALFKFTVSDITIKNESVQMVIDLQNDYNAAEEYNLRAIAYNDKSFLNNVNFENLSSFEKNIFLPEENFYFNQKNPLHDFLINDYVLEGNKIKIKLSNFVVDDYFSMTLTYYNESLNIYNIYVVNIIEDSNFLRTIYDFRIADGLHNQEYTTSLEQPSSLLEERPLFSKMYHAYDDSETLGIFFAFDAYKFLKGEAMFPGLLLESAELLKDSVLSTVIEREQLFDPLLSTNTKREVEQLTPEYVNVAAANNDGFIYYTAKDVGVSRHSQYKYSVYVTYIDITIDAAKLLLSDIDEAIGSILRYRDSDLSTIRNEVQGVITRINGLYTSGDTLPAKYQSIVSTFQKEKSALFSEKIDLTLEMLSGIYNSVATKIPATNFDKHFGKTAPRKLGLTADPRLGQAPRHILAKEPINTIKHSFRDIIKFNEEQNLFIPFMNDQGLKIISVEKILDFIKTKNITVQALFSPVQEISLINKIDIFGIKKVLDVNEGAQQSKVKKGFAGAKVEKHIQKEKEQGGTKPMLAYQETIPVNIEYLANYNIDPLDGENSISSATWEELGANITIPVNNYLLGRIKNYRNVVNSYFLIQT